ncbi:MAG: hypothetical protein AMJ60_10725 [Desulfobacterales bacterium SG8_35]|nr:MAG: hypothetical protein AMJ60_10725 [Desulfobacterales bacterium SG8_35]
MKPSALFLFFTSLLLLVLLSPRILQSEEIINEVFLLERDDKLLAFSGLRNNWFEKDLRTGEKVIESRHDGNVAVAYTSERALAFSAITGRWTGEGFRIRESVISISAEGNVGTVITNIRALGFSAQTGVWVESQFNLDK